MARLPKPLFKERQQVISLSKFEREVIAGLPNEKKRLDCLDENEAWYNHDAERYLPKRDAETDWDFQGRPKRDSGLLHQCVDVLCDHLYNPGPTRELKDDTTDGAEFLRRVYEQNLVNALMGQADILSTLNDVAAIQMDVGDGDFDVMPIRMILWGGNEFHAWCHPDDPREPVAVCTIDRYDNQERRRLWNEVEVRTYLTVKFTEGATTAGGRVAKLVDKRTHDYGCLPFSFVHYEQPSRFFYTHGIGTFLRKVQMRVDDRLSRLDEAIQKHLNPVPIAEGVGPEFNPVVEPGRFVRLLAPPFTGITGDFSAPPAPPRLSYLQATIDVAGTWEDLTNFINQALEASRVPLSYARMEQTGAASGISLIVEQDPLLRRAKKRRVAFARYETDLARCILTCAGNHYGKPGLVAEAEDLDLMLGWPESKIATPGPERDEEDTWRLQMGIVSLIGIIMERDGCSQEQAIQKLKQVAKDRKLEQKILGQDLQGNPIESNGRRQLPGKDEQAPQQGQEDVSTPETSSDAFGTVAGGISINGHGNIINPGT